MLSPLIRLGRNARIVNMKDSQKYKKIIEVVDKYYVSY